MEGIRLGSQVSPKRAKSILSSFGRESFLGHLSIKLDQWLPESHWKPLEVGSEVAWVLVMVRDAEAETTNVTGPADQAAQSLRTVLKFGSLSFLPSEDVPQELPVVPDVGLSALCG